MKFLRKNNFFIWLKFISKGGGSGGSIRDAGGSFGRKEAAAENTYFRKIVNI
jgi:ATPase inhibitor, mitochondrial